MTPAVRTWNSSWATASGQYCSKYSAAEIATNVAIEMNPMRAVNSFEGGVGKGGSFSVCKFLNRQIFEAVEILNLKDLEEAGFVVALAGLKNL